MIGIIGAMDIEVQGMLENMQNIETHRISGVDFHCGEIGEKNVVIAKCGAGKINAALCAQAMIMVYKPDVIINSGVAGGLLPEMKICDCAVATHVCQHDVDLTALGDPLGKIPGINLVNIECDKAVCQKLIIAAEGVSPNRVFSGIIATGDAFINEKKKSEQLREDFSAIACEMEGGAIGQVCCINKTPFAVLRTISDGGDDDSHLSFNEFAKIAADKSIEIILNFIKN